MLSFATLMAGAGVLIWGYFSNGSMGGIPAMALGLFLIIIGNVLLSRKP